MDDYFVSVDAKVEVTAGATEFSFETRGGYIKIFLDEKGKRLRFAVYKPTKQSWFSTKNPEFEIEDIQSVYLKDGAQISVAAKKDRSLVLSRDGEEFCTIKLTNGGNKKDYIKLYQWLVGTCKFKQGVSGRPIRISI